MHFTPQPRRWRSARRNHPRGRDFAQRSAQLPPDEGSPSLPRTPPNTSTPPVRARGINARGSAIAMLVTGTAGTEAHVRHAPSTHANPICKLLGGFAGRISPKRHPAPAFPQVGGADIEQPPPETAQKPRTHGEIDAHFLRNCPESAGTRPQAKLRQPTRMPACSSAQYAHAAKPMLAPNAPQTIARKRSWRTPVEPVPAPTKSNPHQPAKTVTHNYQKSSWRAVIPRFSIVKCRQQISHDNTAPCFAKPPPAIREVTP